MEGQPILITREVERATVRCQAPEVVHVDYSDGVAPLPPPQDREHDAAMAVPTGDVGEEQPGGLRPWSMSLGVSVRSNEGPAADVSSPTTVTCNTLKKANLGKARLALERDSSFLPYFIADGIVRGLPQATWLDASRIVADCRMVQSPRELECTRRAAQISDSMMLTAIATAGPGIEHREVVTSIYQAMLRWGGTFPGFVPLVRSTSTLDQEHSTWDQRRLRKKDMLFVEMSGCFWRYHAPVGRLLHIGKVPARAGRIHAVCCEAMESAVEAIRPGATAGSVYDAWQKTVDKAGLQHYRRHHCGYLVGIGFPPSWSGAGVPVGLRAGSDWELKPGMVFHVLSWLLRTGSGDSFVSDTVLVTETGSEVLTTVTRDLIVR
jgi:Xaa-Pro dipeptidase